jgi:delta-1-pyrroline-5-carboxylate synthetase
MNTLIIVNVSIGTPGIKDNDSLAARVGVEIGADLAILMSDVDGIYNKPPSHDEARILHTFVPSDLKDIEFGGASDVGTGGMESKVLSALWALKNGTSVVICNGMQFESIRRIFRGERCGSFFTNAEDVSVPVELLAQNGRIISKDFLYNAINAFY